MEFTWRSLGCLEKYSRRLISQPLQFTKPSMYCVAAFHSKNESQLQLALSRARDSIPYAKLPPTLSPVVTTQWTPFSEKNEERQTKATFHLSQKSWVRFSLPTAPPLPRLMWYQSLGLNCYYSLSPGYMSVFVVVTLHHKAVIMSVAKRIWKKKISKADFGDILGSLNHHDGIAYLADGENLFTGAKLSLVFSFVPSVQQLDPHPKALFLG